MKELVLSSNNKNKQKEIAAILSDYKILTLEDVGFYDEVDEDQDTFEGNSLKKAKIVSEFCGKDTIADDSGLCIDLLNGAPGVYSARYSELATDEANMDKVLEELNGQTSKAKFVSVITLVKKDGSYEQFRGELPGVIIHDKRGTNGFGYDPIFYLENMNKTLAEITLEEKNKISHRKMALKLLKDYLS